MTSTATPRHSSARGRFIVLEGIDGCGKTTQLDALRQWLPRCGLMPAGTRLITTREPGGTPLGMALRQLLIDPPESIAPCPTSELLLYAADRAQHVERLIRPRLEAGDWVLSDRFSGSTAAYQGMGRGLSLKLIDQLETIATAGLAADLTLWLDLPLEQSLGRRSDRVADRIEAAGDDFLRRVARGFGSLATRRDWHRVDAGQAVDQVSQVCRRLITERFASGLGLSTEPVA